MLAYMEKSSYLCSREKKTYLTKQKQRTMLARVTTLGKDIYQVEAFVTTELGPQWVIVAETRHLSEALELREYIRYYATTRWVARKRRYFEAARRAANEH